ENGPQAPGGPRRVGPGVSGPGASGPGAAGPGGLPQRQPGANGSPAPAGPNGLPQRQPGANGSPQPLAGGLPQREPGASGAPRPEVSRGAASGGLPQREAPGAGAPRPTAGGLPQRQPGATPGLPQRDGAGVQPRIPGGLPRRDPGARLQPLGEAPPGVGRARSAPGQEGAEAGAPARDPGKHSYKSNPAKTASFFQSRLQPAAESDSSMDSPIFAEMMSAWLADPNPDRSEVVQAFDSPADEGWRAAQRASEAKPEKKTAAGLPQRDPGGRLVPGAVSGAADRPPRRDPESIRSSLSRHQKGVRDGR